MTIKRNKKITVRFDPKSYELLQIEAKFHHMTTASLIRKRALNHPLPHVVLATDYQYKQIECELHAINQALSTLGIEVQEQRSTILASIVTKIHAYEGKYNKTQIGKMMTSQAYYQNIVKVLNLNQKKIYPELYTITKNVIKIEKHFNNAFN